MELFSIRIQRTFQLVSTDMRVRGEGWFFDAAYIFLGEKEMYVTDALYIIRIDELDTKSLNRIYQKIILK